MPAVIWLIGGVVIMVGLLAIVRALPQPARRRHRSNGGDAGGDIDIDVPDPHSTYDGFSHDGGGHSDGGGGH